MTMMRTIGMAVAMEEMTARVYTIASATAGGESWICVSGLDVFPAFVSQAMDEWAPSIASFLAMETTTVL